MAIAEMSRQVAMSARDTAQQMGERMNDLHLGDRRWTRALAAGSLFTGAMLLASGRRKAGLAVATAGTVIAMLEEPQGLITAWATLPAYIQAGKQFLTKVEGFVGDISEQSGKFRNLVGSVSR